MTLFCLTLFWYLHAEHWSEY